MLNARQHQKHGEGCVQCNKCYAWHMMNVMQGDAAVDESSKYNYRYLIYVVFV